MMAPITSQATLKAILTLGVCCITLGCGSGDRPQAEVKPESTTSNGPAAPTTTLTIRWQRLVDDSGRTCDRCEKTGESVEAAYQLLKESLAPLGFNVELQKVAIDHVTFAKKPTESNRIWLGDDPIEDLLGAKVGQSRCCSACGDSECRNLTVDGKTYEAITTPLIVKAGLRAAARKVPGTCSTCDPACCGDKTAACCEDKAEASARDKPTTSCCDSNSTSPKK
jgi:hypothetical protein